MLPLAAALIALAAAALSWRRQRYAAAWRAGLLVRCAAEVEAPRLGRDRAGFATLRGRYHGAAQSCAGLRRHDATTVELTRVFVRPGLRGTGGVARLLAAVDEAARAMGAERIVLDTRLDLVEARALYLRNGYREIPAYGETGPYSEIWYGKELTAASR